MTKQPEQRSQPHDENTQAFLAFAEQIKKLSQQDRLQGFLTELAQLTQKYEIAIGGCGCDGSPWLDDLQTDTIIAEYLDYYEEQEYTIMPSKST